MRYDAVVSTLNRPESLRRCLEQLERQSERPSRVIVVDASDDHESVRDQVMVGRDPSVEWLFLRACQRSLPAQRNQGLEHVDSPVVLLPDDDSMLYPDAAAEMMAAYRTDEAQVVGGVSAVGVLGSPLAQDSSTQISRSRRLKDRVEPLRGRFEDSVVPKPFVSYPESLWPSRAVPSWVDGSRFALVPTVGGYRLSLRTDVAKAHRFDETLGYGIGYALHEDMELSLRLQRAGYLLLGAQHARVFHDVHPSKRAGGFNYGFCWIANYLYSCRRNVPESATAWTRHLPRYLRYKLLLYRSRAEVRRDEYSREVFLGARRAWELRHQLTTASQDELSQRYRALCDAEIRR